METLERRKATLFERTDALRIVQEWIDEADREDKNRDIEMTPELLQLVAEAEGDFRHKAIAVALFIQEQQEEAEAIERHIERLQARAGTRRGAAERLKQILHSQMVATGQELIRDPLVSIRLQASPPAVRHTLTEQELRDIAQRDPEVVRIVPERVELNAREVVRRWKETGEVPSEKVEVTTGTHIRIR